MVHKRLFYLHRSCRLLIGTFLSVHPLSVTLCRGVGGERVGEGGYVHPLYISPGGYVLNMFEEVGGGLTLSDVSGDHW